MIKIEQLDYEGAIAGFTRTIELRPKNINSLLNRGKSYYELGYYYSALEDYNRAIELNSEVSIAYYIRGLIYIKLDDTEKAKNDLEKAVELGDENAKLELQRVRYNSY